MRTALLLSLASFVVTGCAAVWGAGHKVVSSDESGIKIQFDRSLSSSARMAALAREHCKKFGKVAEPMDGAMPGLLLGIIEETYACVSPART